jgi:hypothetical protein
MKSYFLKILIIILIITILFCIINKVIENPNNEYFTTRNKVCCLYAYYEKNELYKTNFEYFLENAILDNIDYYVIINGDSTVKIPERFNIAVFHRRNKGYDFGAYSFMIKRIIKDYDYYVFLNATVKGPYLKSNDNRNWLNIFLELFKDNVKLVGTSVCYTDCDRVKNKYNIDNIYYIQTMFFIINKELFIFLNKENFFDDEEELNNETKMENIVIGKEIKLSYLTYLSNGNINCILDKYRNLDFKNLKNDINQSSFHGDPYFPNRYFCSTIIPEDVIFFKNKRFIEDVKTLETFLDDDYNKNTKLVCKF